MTPDPAAAPPWVRDFKLAAPPPGFIDDPYPVYAALRAHDPVHELAPGSVLLTRYDDVLAVYRSPTVSSDKKRAFAPKLGGDCSVRVRARCRISSSASGDSFAVLFSVVSAGLRKVSSTCPS